MGDILSRIAQIADNEGIKIGAMERKIGASKGVLSRAIANGTDIQSKWIQLIVENFPLYSAAWLLTGIGPMLRTSDAATPAAPKVETSAAAPAAARVAAVENQPDAILALMDKISSMMEKIEGLARENGQLRERVNRMEEERERLFAHSGGGKLPPPTPPATTSATPRPGKSPRPTSSPQSGSPLPDVRSDASKTARK